MENIRIFVQKHKKVSWLVLIGYLMLLLIQRTRL